jgi:O-antigen/teichoic acid export membrane protein
MDVKHLPIPDLCHTHDWSPIAAATGQAPVAAVLAGFSFSAATVLLSVTGENRNEDAASRAVRLLFTAFFGLAVVSYLYADLGGDQACPRSEIEAALNGGILATFAVIMIVALTHLTMAYRPRDFGLLALLRGLVYVAAIFVLLLLGTNATTSVNADLTYGSHSGVSTALFAVTGVAAVGIGLWSWRMEVRPKEGNAGDGHGDAEGQKGTAGQKGAAGRPDAVSHCTWTALGYLAIAGTPPGVVLSVPAEYYYPPPAWLVYVTAWASILMPLIVLALAIRALARPTPTVETDPGSSQEAVS